jgi:hypothetical protein
VVVARDHQHAAEARAARGIGMAEDVSAAIDARPLAVPHREYAIVTGARRQMHLLAAPHGGRGEVFVDAGLEYDAVFVEVAAGFPQRLIQAAERRAPVARHEAGRVQAGGCVADFLDHQQTDQRLVAAQVDAAARGSVLVVQAGRLRARIEFGHGTVSFHKKGLFVSRRRAL